jgi:hypothetical protein
MTRTEAPQNISIPIPLTQEALQTARQFASEQSTPQKVEQIYLNTLSVYAVNNYLRMLGIKTDLTIGDSWNPIVRLVSNVADLWVTDIGRLECRPLPMTESQLNTTSQPRGLWSLVNWLAEGRSPATPTACFVPPESQDDRMGYVVVQIDLAQQQAVLLGFTQTVVANTIALPDLQPMTRLLKVLSEEPQSSVQLSQWWQNLFTAGWQSLESLLDISAVNQTLGQVAFRRGNNNLRRAKLFDLETGSTSVEIVLVVHLTQKDSGNFGIELQVFPTQREMSLPHPLALRILDDTGSVFFEAITNEGDRVLQSRQFSGQAGERFSVQLAFEENSVLEAFIV